ncbi:MAG: hypothetical protein Q8N63_07860 [Nanoarchaeota archaeon]|nr:hypothetical protein [Nanoarchaeota archaeon]
MENLEKTLENNKVTIEKPHIGDFTRKSVVGAIYRVGASFAIDAVYLTAVAAIGYYLTDKYDALGSTITASSDFIHNFDPGKFARVVAAVIGINFVDYRFDVTNRLDTGTRKIINLIKKRKR